MTPPEPALSVSRLRVAYGGTVALDGVDLSARPGQVTALLGPNGAGKTSLVEACLGLRRAAGGQIRVLGRDVRHLSRADRSAIGAVLQDGGLPLALTARQALRDRARLFRTSQDPDHLLDVLGLAPRAATRVRRLSGGEARRLALALALVGRPRLLFLDEPGAGLDPHGRELMNALVRGLADDGVAILLSSHLLDDVEKVADQVVILDRGSVAASGRIEDLTHAEQESVGFSGPLHLDLTTLLVALPAGSRAREVASGRYLVTTGADQVSPATLATITAWCAQHGVIARDLTVGRQTLEEVYLRLTRPVDLAGRARP